MIKDPVTKGSIDLKILKMIDPIFHICSLSLVRGESIISYIRYLTKVYKLSSVFAKIITIRVIHTII